MATKVRIPSQVLVEADFSMNSKKITGLAPATNPSDAVRLDQIGGGLFLVDGMVDLEQSSWYYYGGIKAGNWQVNRVSKSDVNLVERANVDDNPTVTDISTAWAQKLTLVYN